MSSGRWRHAHLDQSRSRQAGGWGYGRVDGTSSGRSRFRATKLIPPPALVYGHRGDETHLWVHRVYGLQFPENVGMDYVVVIEEKQMVSSCRRCATVSGYGLKRIALVAHVSDSRVIPKPACDAFSGIVRGTVIDQYDLMSVVRKLLHRLLGIVMRPCVGATGSIVHLPGEVIAKPSRLRSRQARPSRAVARWQGDKGDTQCDP